MYWTILQQGGRITKITQTGDFFFKQITEAEEFPLPQITAKNTVKNVYSRLFPFLKCVKVVFVTQSAS